MRKLIFAGLGVLVLAFAVRGLLENTPERVLPEGVAFYQTDLDFYALEWHQEAGQTEKTLFAGGRNGLYRFDGQAFTFVKAFPGTDVRALYCDESLLYIGSEQGLYRYDGRQFDLLLPQRIECLAMSGDGLWAGTLTGAYRIGDGFRISEADGLLSDYVYTMLVLPDGAILFGGYEAKGGITLYRDGNFAAFAVSDGLPHPYVTSFLEIDGLVWAGTGFFDRGGACRLVIKDSEMVLDAVLSKEDGLAGEKVRGLYRDRNGYIWFASEADGIAIFDGGEQIRLLTANDYLPHDEVLCFLEDVDNGLFRGLWMGTPSGAVYLDETACLRPAANKQPPKN